VVLDGAAAASPSESESEPDTETPLPSPASAVASIAPPRAAEAPAVVSVAPGAMSKPEASTATSGAAPQAELPTEMAAAPFEAPTSRASVAASGSVEGRGAARSPVAGVDLAAWQLSLLAADDTRLGAAASVDADADNATRLPDLASALRERSLALALEPLRRESAQAQNAGQQFVVGGSALSAGLSVGYVLWLARGGVLMASVLSALPAWASLDPLPVLGQVKPRASGRGGIGGAAADDDEDDDDQDAVEQLFSHANAKPANGPVAPVPEGVA
jgi:hypothetical protein